MGEVRELLPHAVLEDREIGLAEPGHVALLRRSVTETLSWMASTPVPKVGGRCRT